MIEAAIGLRFALFLQHNHVRNPVRIAYRGILNCFPDPAVSFACDCEHSGLRQAMHLEHTWGRRTFEIGVDIEPVLPRVGWNLEHREPARHQGLQRATQDCSHDRWWIVLQDDNREPEIKRLCHSKIRRHGEAVVDVRQAGVSRPGLGMCEMRAGNVARDDSREALGQMVGNAPEAAAIFKYRREIAGLAARTSECRDQPVTINMAGGEELVLGARDPSRQIFIMTQDRPMWFRLDRKSTRLNSSHSQISYAVFCLKKKT